MKRLLRIIGLFCCALILNSCATRPDVRTIIPASILPVDVEMNKEAGRGMLLFVKIQMESGEEIPCALDTGSPASHLPREVEGALGDRLGTRRFETLDGEVMTEHIYKAPRLYLGSIRLVTGDRMGAAGNSIGVLGMDCLRHYCIQLDFQAGKIRFLDPERLDVTELGTAFQLTDTHYTRIKHPGFFDQTASELLVDTGCSFDTYLEPRRLQRAVKNRQNKPVPMMKEGVLHPVSPFTQFSDCDWNGGHYTNLLVGKGPNLIGLRFLARHLVTFNFPKGVMYLKQTNVGPL